MIFAHKSASFFPPENSEYWQKWRSHWSPQHFWCLGVLCLVINYYLGTGIQTQFFTLVLVAFLKIHHYALCFCYSLTFWGSKNTRTFQAIHMYHVNIEDPNGLEKAQWLNSISQLVPLHRFGIGLHLKGKHMFNFLFLVIFLNILYDIVKLLSSWQSHFC